MFHFLIPAAMVVAIVSRLVYNFYRPGISHIPGPWICKFTDAYRAYRAWRGDSYLWWQELHATYGDLVRIGPNTILDSEHGEFQRVFGFKEDYEKTDAMKVWQALVKGKPVVGLVSAKDKSVHGKLRRPVASLYSNTNVLHYHPRMQETIKYFIKRLDEEFISTGRTCDIDNWVQYFAFDIVGQLTLSRNLGFLKQGKDVDGMLRELHDELEYRGVTQSMPWTDDIIRKNPINIRLRQATSFFAANSRKLIADRMQDEKHTGVDMLDGFLEAQKKHPEVVNDGTLGMYVSTNFLAGSDTTSVTMRSIIWYVLHNPPVLRRLREELDAKISAYPPTYQEAMDLKYVDAVIHEALRIHPIGSLVFEREAPATGHTTLVSGTHLPPKTQIAITPWTLNYDEKVWGPEPKKFNPDRWMAYKGESEEAYATRLAEMKNNDFSFSYGPRACLGRHIAWLELVSVIPTLFGLLDMELAQPEQDWKVYGAFFARQYNLDVRLKWRAGVDKSEIFDGGLERIKSA